MTGQCERSRSATSPAGARTNRVRNELRRQELMGLKVFAGECQLARSCRSSCEGTRHGARQIFRDGARREQRHRRGVSRWRSRSTNDLDPRRRNEMSAPMFLELTSDEDLRNWRLARSASSARCASCSPTAERGAGLRYCGRKRPPATEMRQPPCNSEVPVPCRNRLRCSRGGVVVHLLVDHRVPERLDVDSRAARGSSSAAI